jgi:hypothetical protein
VPDGPALAPAGGVIVPAAMPAARLVLAVTALLALPLASARADDSGLVSAKVGQRPLSDAAAAAKVVHSSFEPRPANASATHRVPTKAQLRAFHRQSDETYSHWVTGRFRGTTDEVIQWAAAKWGLAPDLVRAVAAKETWWRMSHVGDDGDSFGLFQVRRPSHCRGTLVCGLFRHDAALNADYWSSIIRSYYDGKQTWLNTVSGNGARYAAGDLWGSIGAWFSGRWHDAGSEGYVTAIKDYMARRIWRTRDFAGG